MEITQADIDAFMAKESAIQNLTYYANQAWIWKYGQPMLKQEDKPIAVMSGFHYPKALAKMESDLSAALKILEIMTEEDLTALESLEIPFEMPSQFEAIPEEMRDLMDVIAANKNLLENHYPEDTIWRCTGPNEVITTERLLQACKKGYHRVDFEAIWNQVEAWRRMKQIKEELLAAVWHPDRVAKWIGDEKMREMMAP